MNRTVKLIILVNLLALIGYFVYAVRAKEKILKEGKRILLELAPVDPRSMLQGDFMLLRYKIADFRQDTAIPKRGYFVVSLDTAGVARLLRIQSGKTPLSANEYLLEYNHVGILTSIGAESYFFEEGQSARFEKAKYGALQVDAEGNTVLLGLCDDNRRLIP